jgi:hypothetical protein
MMKKLINRNDLQGMECNSKQPDWSTTLPGKRCKQMRLKRKKGLRSTGLEQSWYQRTDNLIGTANNWHSKPDNIQESKENT